MDNRPQYYVLAFLMKMMNILVKMPCKVIIVVNHNLMLVSITPVIAEFNERTEFRNVGFNGGTKNYDNVEGNKFVIIRIKNKANELLWRNEYDCCDYMNGEL